MFSKTKGYPFLLHVEPYHRASKVLIKQVSHKVILLAICFESFITKKWTPKLSWCDELSGKQVRVSL